MTLIFLNLILILPDNNDDYIEKFSWITIVKTSHHVTWGQTTSIWT